MRAVFVYQVVHVEEDCFERGGFLVELLFPVSDLPCPEGVGIGRVEHTCSGAIPITPTSSR